MFRPQTTFTLSLCKPKVTLFVAAMLDMVMLVFPFLVFLNLSNYLKYWSSYLRNTGMMCVPVSIWKYILVQTLLLSITTVLRTTYITYLQILLQNNLTNVRCNFKTGKLDCFHC